MTPQVIQNLFDPPDIKTLFLLPADDASQTGTGSPENPLRVHDASHFMSIVTQQTAGAIHLYPGVYAVPGIWNWPGHTWSSRPLRLTGSGANRTTLQLDKNSTTFDGTIGGQAFHKTDVAVLRLGVPFNNTSGPYLLADLTLDGNESAFPGHFVTGGAVIYGSQVVIRNVCVRGLRGFAAPNRDDSLESFGFLLNNWVTGGFAGPDGGSVIEKCVVYHNSDVDPYHTAFYVGYEDFNRGLLTSALRDCQAINLGPTPGGNAFSFNAAVVIDGCSAVGYNNGLYNDTGALSGVVARGCRFQRLGYRAVALIGTEADAAKRSVTVSDCLFEYQPPAGREWIGMHFDDPGGKGTVIENVLVRDCTFVGPTPDPVRPFQVFGGRGLGLRNIRIVNCIVPSNAVQHAIQPLNAGAVDLTSLRAPTGTTLPDPLPPLPT